MKNYLKIMGLLLLLSFFYSCKTVDLRSNYLIERSLEQDLTQKGVTLLTRSYEAMGYDKLALTKTYEAKAKFQWRKALLLMPMNSLPGNNENEIQFRFATNTFDGQVEYLEGRKEKKIFGLQSWQGYYAKNESNTPVECNSKRYSWGLSTYHYLVEAPMRLLNAEIIRYAGEKELHGKSYDLVFVTWGSEAPNKEYDQWLLYMNKETQFIDLAEITISDFFVPTPKGLQHGTVIYEDRVNTSIGAHLPSEVIIQIGKPKDSKKRAYRFELNDYKFDSFDIELLYPLEGLQIYGDSKPKVDQ